MDKMVVKMGGSEVGNGFDFGLYYDIVGIFLRVGVFLKFVYLYMGIYGYIWEGGRL